MPPATTTTGVWRGNPLHLWCVAGRGGLTSKTLAFLMQVLRENGVFTPCPVHIDHPKKRDKPPVGKADQQGAAGQHDRYLLAAGLVQNGRNRHSRAVPEHARSNGWGAGLHRGGPPLAERQPPHQ